MMRLYSMLHLNSSNFDKSRLYFAQMQEVLQIYQKKLDDIAFYFEFVRLTKCLTTFTK